MSLRIIFFPKFNRELCKKFCVLGSSENDNNEHDVDKEIKNNWVHVLNDKEKISLKKREKKHTEKSSMSE